MIRRLLTALAALVVLIALSCGGDDGAEGPMGPAGTDGTDGTDAGTAPFKLMIVGAAPTAQLDTLAGKMALSGVFARGTEIAVFSVDTATPTLGTLTPHDVVLVFSENVFDDRVALGNVLADYVDGGGRVVTGAFCYSDPASNYALAGRFTTSSYMPALASNAAVTLGDFDVSSIAIPIHAIFHGLGVEDFSFWSNSFHKEPGLTSWGTLLATDTNGSKLVMINTDETVISLGIFPLFQFDARGSDGVRRLIANSLAYLAGALN